MDIIHQLALYMHVISGGVALIAGTIAMTTRKGSQKHIIAGKFFYYSMWLVIVLVLYISILKNLSFLLHVGIFAFFQNHNGFRAVKNKTLQPNLFDWFILLVAGINAVFMIYSLQPILIAFGGISVLLFYSQTKTYLRILKQKEIPPLHWLTQHIGMMIGSFIATITAFLVVNTGTLLPATAITMTTQLIVWLSPTIILVPLSIYWQTKYTQHKQKDRFNRLS
ncbi:MAG: hypothetical protein HRU40_04535 [Saprospiraceae bacterium]|nr:hypothetical protein [Saprospiraceae bacterium]